MIDLAKMVKDILTAGIPKITIWWEKGVAVEHRLEEDKVYPIYVDKKGLYINKYDGKYYLTENNSQIV